MAWVPIPNNTDWEYANASTKNGATAGVRTSTFGQEVYVSVRKAGEDLTGYANEDRGEISKTYWDAQS